MTKTLWTKDFIRITLATSLGAAGGIISGFSGGIILTCGCSTGGLDVLGLYLSKKGKGFTVGRFSITFNTALYALCAVLFDLTTAIYSAIYVVFQALFLDRVHQQNINVQALIFTREDEGVLADFIIKKLGRSVTYWNGVGAYTKDNVHVLCVCLSKYEIEDLRHAVHEIDPHAFFIINQGVTVDGNFVKKLNG